MKNNYAGLNSWYEKFINLSEEELNGPNEIYEYITKKIDECEDEVVKKEFNNLTNYLASEKIQSIYPYELNKSLQDDGLVNDELRKSILINAHPSFYLLFETEYLRELNDSDFFMYVKSVVELVYVKRKYSKTSNIQRELNLEEREHVTELRWFLDTVYTNFFDQNAAFDDMEDMLKSIAFSERKIELFKEVLIENYNDVERYFMFEQMHALKRDMHSIIVNINKIKNA